MVKAENLTKKYGDKLAVDRLSFTVRPGVVTGFLRPNGSGKSTTMRMIMGLDIPSAGRVTIDGRTYHELRWPLRQIGGLLEAKAIPASAVNAIDKFLPAKMADSMMSIVPVPSDPPAFAPWAGFALLCAYVAVTLGAGAWLVNHRDA